MKCPSCGLFNPEEAARCDCGFGLQTDGPAQLAEGRGARRFRSRAVLLTVVTLVNVGLSVAFYLGLLGFASWASRLVWWEELLFLAALPMAGLGLVLSLQRPRLVPLAAINGFLTMILAGLWASFFIGPGLAPR